MIKKYRILLARFLFAGDLTLVLISWIVAYYLRFYFDLIPATKGIYSFSYHMSLAIMILTIWGLALQFSGLYKFKRLTSRMRAFQKIFNASVIAMLIFIAATYLFQEYRFSRGVIGYFFVVNLCSLLLFRIIFREVVFYLRKNGYNLRHVLIIGNGQLARKTAQTIEKHEETGIKIRGFIASNPEDGGLPALGTIDQLQTLIQDGSIDQIIIALDAEDYSHLNRVLHLLRNETVDVKIVPEFYRFASLRYDIEELDNLPFITLNDTPLDGWNFLLKRTMDITLGSIFLILFLPLIVVVSIAIKLFSPGPVFYKQERMGLDGKKFAIYKFRTMKVGAEKETGAIWASSDDPRKTRFGAFLRKYSIDEIPQLINVIKGEMSLVGPRPERPVFVNQFKKHYPNYMLRHKVRAGLTGWAQVNGWRGNTALDKRIEYDLYYIKNWSAFLDFKILWLTVWKGIFSKNAY